jgi:protein-S-isoprenylcysteine O-methyltransferase Ste14
MNSGEIGRARALAIGASIVATAVVALFCASYLVSVLLGLPLLVGLPVVVRLLGGVLVAFGLAMIAWAFRQRGPANVIVSTYVTLVKALNRTPSAERAGRTEPLVVSGPQKYTRNPLYFGVVVMVLGWAFVGAYSFVFVATLVILLWFALVVIPMEERELSALFGEEWKMYAEETPMLVPFTKRKKRPAAL